MRRALVAVIALVMTTGLLGAAPAEAAPTFRDRVWDTRPNPDVYLRGSGWGHSVGMSQYGAYAMARAGKGYGKILHHYYTNIGIEKREMPKAIKVGLNNALPLSNVDALTGGFYWRANINGTWRKRWQPKGTTWAVTLGSGGKFVLKQGGDVKWRVDSSRLLASFNWNAAAGGTRIEAYSPNLHDPPGPEGPEYRADYQWGRLEYTPRSLANQTMNMVLEVPGMELYLRGLAEMPAYWGTDANRGLPALKAQAIVGRSYAKHLHSTGLKYCRCHILATPANQHYLGYDHESVGAPWVKAVRDTAGIVATHGGAPIEAFYSSSHGGRSENIEDSWAYGAAYGYLRSVDDPWSLQTDTGNPNTQWDFRVGNGSFSNFVGGIAKVRRVKVVGSRTAGGTPKTIRVWGLSSSGTPTRIDRTGRKGIVGVSLKDTYGKSGLKSQQIRRFGFAPFLDDDGSVHEYAIVFATRARIMYGTSSTTFAPRATVTRGAAAQYLYRTFKIPPAPDGTDYFNDDDGHANEVAINALAHAGVFKGRRFEPDATLIRAHFAVFLQRATGVSNVSKDFFTDDEDSPHEAAINAVAARKFMTGCSATRFCPGGPVRRGTFATTLLAVVEHYR